MLNGVVETERRHGNVLRDGPPILCAMMRIRLQSAETLA
ncbi:unnamed protein product [Chondrus crispus]|uniref:Uncharacterized protein n=1 Tax=Chondrus crispus TaxID=2769 RepID=R7QT79_CHOCR|nr:unnamed protein product [Chondrus crispus]CDF40560.1 unnamed protein product [Chondrus crispus]|eukprot:XP_005710854.1 unnamed protein product [Chondrus crispus]